MSDTGYLMIYVVELGAASAVNASLKNEYIDLVTAFKTDLAVGPVKASYVTCAVSIVAFLEG